MRRFSLLLALVPLAVGAGCRPAGPGTADSFADRTIRVTATTSLVADLARAVGGERVAVTGLMGPGVDPHLYKASEGDVARMAGADVVFYGGLHLEGKMGELFEEMAGRGVRAVAVTDGIPRERLLASEAFQGNYDPHVWFDVALWKEAAQTVAQTLAEMDPTHAAQYEANLTAYAQQLDSLDAYVRAQVATVPEAQRVLVTAHDAFGYFGRAYGFEVHGLQGISTATEAGTADVQRLAAFIAERRLPALFVESSVSPRAIEAVQAAVRARGHDVQMGGSLFSDALGNPGTPEGTYLGMVRYNVDTITRALRADAT